jgi:hypothetical protein
MLYANQARRALDPKTKLSAPTIFAPQSSVYTNSSTTLNSALKISSKRLTMIFSSGYEWAILIEK